MGGGRPGRSAFNSSFVTWKPGGSPLGYDFLCLIEPSQKYTCNFAWIIHPPGPVPFRPGNFESKKVRNDSKSLKY